MVCERVDSMCWEVEMVDVTDCLTPRVFLSAVFLQSRMMRLCYVICMGYGM